MINKKIITLLIVCMMLFIIFLYFLNKEFSYEHEYKINNYSIIENYNKDKNHYTFLIDNKYEFSLYSKYSNKRELIDEIKIKDKCLAFDGDLNFYDFCFKDSKYYLNAETTNKKKYKEYKDIKFYDIKNTNIFIWNYSGYVFSNNGEKSYHELFKNDVYVPNLIKQVDNYLFIPNYDQKYYFNSYYLIDMKTGKSKLIKLDTEINFDLEYIFYEENSLKIYDKKNFKVFNIDIKNGDTFTKNNVRYSNSELNDMNKKISHFILTKDDTLKYVIEDFEMYITTEKVSSIVYQDREKAYYIVGDSLYYYEIGSSITKIVQNEEWKFNFNSMIYIY